MFHGMNHLPMNQQQPLIQLKQWTKYLIQPAGRKLHNSHTLPLKAFQCLEIPGVSNAGQRQSSGSCSPQLFQGCQRLSSSQAGVTIISGTCALRKTGHTSWLWYHVKQTWSGRTNRKTIGKINHSVYFYSQKMYIYSTIWWPLGFTSQGPLDCLSIRLPR